MCISAPKPPPAPVIPQPQDANQARVDELRRRANAKGFMSSISPGTLLGTSAVNPNNDASVAPPKTLMGQ